MSTAHIEFTHDSNLRITQWRYDCTHTPPLLGAKPKLKIISIEPTWDNCEYEAVITLDLEENE